MDQHKCVAHSLLIIKKVCLIVRGRYLSVTFPLVAPTGCGTFAGQPQLHDEGFGIGAGAKGSACSAPRTVGVRQKWAADHPLCQAPVPPSAGTLLLAGAVEVARVDSRGTMIFLGVQL